MHALNTHYTAPLPKARLLLHKSKSIKSKCSFWSLHHKFFALIDHLSSKNHREFFWHVNKSCLSVSQKKKHFAGQTETVVVADSLYSSSSPQELDQTTTHLASSPPYLPHPPTHSTATVAPLDLTTSTESVSRQSETYGENNNNNHSGKNDNKYDSNIHEQEHQHGNFENNANDGNNSAAVAFSQVSTTDLSFFFVFCFWVACSSLVSVVVDLHTHTHFTHESKKRIKW